MKGGTRKRGNSWSYYFDLGQVDGKRKLKEKGGFATKKEAETALAAAINEYNNAGATFTPSDVTVEDYLNFWFDNYCKTNLKIGTQQNYIRVITNYLIPTFGAYKIKAINSAAIQNWVNSLKLRGLSKSSVMNIYGCFKTALEYAVEPMRYIQYNPCDHVRIPKFAKREKAAHFVLSPDDFQKVIDRFPEDKSPFYVPLMIGYYTGMRISEVFALTWDDVDFENRTITVNKQTVKRNFGVDVRKVLDTRGKKEEKSSWYFGTPKTETSNRIIPFGETLYQVLKSAHLKKNVNRMKYGEFFIEHYLKSEVDEKGEKMLRIIPASRALNVAMPSADLICVHDNGELVSSDSFKYCARVVHYELNIDFNFHSLRYTHATRLLENGASVKAIQDRLGHANAQTTLNVYAHNTKRLTRDAVDIFENAAKSKPKEAKTS